MNNKLIWTTLAIILLSGAVYLSPNCFLWARSCVNDINIEVDKDITLENEEDESILSETSVSLSSSNKGAASVSDKRKSTTKQTGGKTSTTTTTDSEVENIPPVTEEDVNEPEPTSSGVAFHSDWRTGTGTSDSALLDTNKSPAWDQVAGNGLVTIVPASGLGFPAGISNVMRVETEWNGSGSAGRWVRVNDQWSAPAIGESIYYRWYANVVVPDIPTGSPHSIQDGWSTGDTNWEWGPLNTGSTWKMRMSFQANSYPNNRWSYNGLAKNEAYRIELRIHRIGTTTFNAHVRVYNSSGTLVADDDDFKDADGSGSGGRSLADNPTLTFENVANITDLSFGSNGAFQGSSAGDHPAYFYYGGGVCIRTDTWCGPYSGGI